MSSARSDVVTTPLISTLRFFAFSYQWIDKVLEPMEPIEQMEPIKPMKPVKPKNLPIYPSFPCPTKGSF